MAGGQGTRLQPLTDGCPKPLVHFVNKPVLGHLLDLLKQHHIVEVVITTHHLADRVKSCFGDGRQLGMIIHYVAEEKPLGTAGGVKNAQAYLGNETFLVISGDAITDIDLSSLCRFHRQKPALATLALTHVADPRGYGAVVTDANGSIHRYIEKPHQNQIISNAVNTGIYVLEPEVLALMEPGRKYDFSLDIFPQLLRQGTLFGYFVDGYWCDIGTIPSYLGATFDALAGKVKHIACESNNGQHPNEMAQSDREELLKPLSKYQKLVLWGGLALLMAAGDYVMGPFLQFPFLFVFPVSLASWYNGRKWGLLLAVILPLFRLYFSTLWLIPWTMLDASINAVIRILVLSLVAVLVDRTAVQNRALNEEIRVLRGIVPICSFCKRIRSDNNAWEQLESYITQHSEAQFSHGLCPECAQEHYREFFTENSPVSQAS